MYYLFIGIGIVFVAFCLWAIIEANNFSSAPKNKKEKAKPKPDEFSDENYILVKEEKPKKVKIKTKETETKKTKDDSQVVPVFIDDSEEVKPVDQKELEEKEKEELYKKYVLGQKEENEEVVSDEDEIDREIERRIAEIRRKNAMIEPNEVIEQPVEFSPQANQEPSEKNYYGFGVGAGRSSGSMKDPNFDPWADEVTNNRPIIDIDLNKFDDDFDEDVIANIMGKRSTVRNERLFRGNRLFGNNEELRTSRLGPGSVSGQVNPSSSPYGSNMIIGQSINTRPDIFGDVDV